MSADFTGVKNVIIPEGRVKRIYKQESGELVWAKTYTVTTLKDLSDNFYSYYTIMAGGNAILNGIYSIPVGSEFVASIISQPGFSNTGVYFDRVRKSNDYAFDITCNLYVSANVFVAAGVIEVNIYTEDFYNQNFG